MPSKLNGDVLTTPKGKPFNVFNQHSKNNELIKRYKKILINQVSQFLRTADDDADEFDVARYLKQQDMTNDRITSSQGYKQIVKKALEDKPLSLGGGKKRETDKARMPQIL